MSVAVPFNYISTADQSWTVPSGITTINVTLNGAGGYSWAEAVGGAGGLVSGTLAVTPGETLLLSVGSRGISRGGAGGNLVAIKRGTLLLAVAGSGGGAGQNAYRTVGGSYGGAGGGLVGQQGGGQNNVTYSAAYGGGGGTQSGGGLGGGGNIAYSGSFKTGGSGQAGWSGDGGAGYYGGGGGSDFAYQDSGGGGGGSSYVDLLTGNVVNTQGGGAPAATNGSITIYYSPITCFAENSNLLTPSGYKEAKDIKTGDLLMTADGRKVPIKAYRTTLTVNKDSAPFLVPKNALGMGCPKADLRLSPWHAIQMNNGLWMKPMSLSELVPGSVQQYDIGKVVTYYHFEAPNFFKDNLVCDGTVVESYGADQLDNVKGRVYNYDSKLKAYTRISGKPVAKKLTM